MVHVDYTLLFPNTSKDHERNVRYIKGGLLRKGGYLANVDGGPKKQHFPAFSQKFYFALVRINSQKFAHLKKWKKKCNVWKVQVPR